MNKPIRKRKPPAYQEYASDVLSSVDFRTMSLAERGLFYTIRLECWVNGKIPVIHEEMSMLLNLPLDAVRAASTERVKRQFVIEGDMLYSKELEDYRDHLSNRSKAQSDGGSRGGKATQAQNREARSNQAKLKPLRGEEQNRTELNRDELAGEGEIEAKKFVEDYESEESAFKRREHDFNQRRRITS